MLYGVDPTCANVDEFVLQHECDQVAGQAGISAFEIAILQESATNEGLDGNYSQSLFPGCRQHLFCSAMPHVVGYRANVEVVAKLLKRLQEKFEREVSAESGEPNLFLLF